MATLNKERAATVLVEALFFGDQQAANRYGLTTRTVENYRNRLKEDGELSAIFQELKFQFQSDWVEELPAAIRQGARFLTTAFQSVDPADPAAIDAVSNAMKTLAEIGLTKELIDERYGKPNRQNNERVVEMGTKQKAITANQPGQA